MDNQFIKDTALWLISKAVFRLGSCQTSTMELIFVAKQWSTHTFNSLGLSNCGSCKPSSPLQPAEVLKPSLFKPVAPGAGEMRKFFL